MKGQLMLPKLLMYSCVFVLILYTPITAGNAVTEQEYDPHTFNFEKIAFSSLGNFTPSNILEEVITGSDIRIFSLDFTFDIPENLYLLENNISLEYGVELTLNLLDISINTSVSIFVEWNNEELIWSVPAEIDTGNMSISSQTYQVSTQYREDIAVQSQNHLKIEFAIHTYGTPSSNVSISINEDYSYIIVSRVRGFADIPSTILTFLILGIFGFFIIILPIWLFYSIKFGTRSPIPYLIKIEFTINSLLIKFTRHTPNKVKKCPSCEFRLTSVSSYCPNCGLDLNQGLIGVFRVIPFNHFKKTFPYILGFLILPLVLFLPNMSFPIVTGLMILAIFLAGQTLAIAKPSFDEAISEILIWKRQGGQFKKLISLILLVFSMVFYLEVFIIAFSISFGLFLVTVYLITRFSSNIATSETKILLERYQKEFHKIGNNLEAWEKGGKFKKVYLTALGRSKGRMAKKHEEKTLHVEKKKEQMEMLEKDFIATQVKARDLRRTYVYANYGVTWFSGSFLAFTLSNHFYKFAQSNSLPTFGLPLSRLGFIDETPFLFLHIILFFGILMYCFLKDPLKPELTFLPFQKLRFEIDEGIMSTKVKYFCKLCNKETGQVKLKRFFNLRKSKDTLIDHASKYLTPCDECGLWVGSECVLMDACLKCHPFCSSCGEKLIGNNQSICQVCQQPFRLKEQPQFCKRCGLEIIHDEKFCQQCGLLIQNHEIKTKNRIN